ncbi:MAG: N-acetylglucosamine-6-phosphate deacetylase [Lachnospiraceae bacterium]|nr:N-acetylglucosamine-6-phosphate deacetylase [Lachnospiraceae bacterium]
MIFKNANVFNGKEFVPGEFAVSGGKFVEVRNVSDHASTDLSGAYVIPGLIDIHTHGNSGADFSDGDLDGLKMMSKFYLRNGVTSFCPTSLTLPYDVLGKAFETAKRLADNPESDGARVIGIHMEGPYFSEKAKGAQNPEYLKNPDYEGFKKLYDDCGGLIRLVDIAPELEHAVEFTEKVSRFTTVSVAHTAGTYNDASRVFDAGASHLTHLFNGMTTIHHRNPGVIEASSERDNVMAELICDGLHVHESVIRLAFKLFPERICLISDSLRCAGMPDGEYMIGGQKCRLKNNIAKLADGHIAGSASNVHQCLLNVIQFGIDKAVAINAATINPARSIGLDNLLGSITPGKLADFIVCDESLENFKAIYKEGRLV